MGEEKELKVPKRRIKGEEDEPEVRRLSRFWYLLIIALAVVTLFISINQVFNLHILGISMWTFTYFYTLLGLCLSVVFLTCPGGKKKRKGVPWYDIVFFVSTVGISLYMAAQGPQMQVMGWELIAPPLPTAMAVVLWLLILEASRRCAGLSFMIIAAFFSFYPVFAGVMPGFLKGIPYDFLTSTRMNMFGRDGVMGVPLSVFGNLLIGFMLFSAALQHTGGGKFFLDLAMCLLGKYRGGPAKVCIVASGLFGTITGSAVASVMAIGTVTIPTMKRVGFRPSFAAGVEACASTGGAIMPPVMGATGFVMAAFLNIPYAQVALAAAIPAVLYYYSIFVQVDGYAAMHELKGLPKEELPSLVPTIKHGWVYLSSFVILIYLLFTLRIEAWAPFIATLGLLIPAMFKKETRFNLKKLGDFLFDTGKQLAYLLGILAGVGFIMGSFSFTGLAQSFSREIVYFLGDNMYVLLFTGALAAFILGMGMTATAVYIFMAIVVAPALTGLGLDVVAVHLFLLYWGVISYITPPVAVAAFAAAAIAETTAWSAGIEAVKIGAAKFLIPFMFVLGPALILHGTPSQILLVVCTAVLGITVFAGGIAGFLFGVGKLPWLSRAILIGSGLLLALPQVPPTIAGAAGSTLGIIIAIVRKKALAKKEAAALGTPGGRTTA